MMTTAEPPRCKIARLIRWFQIGHDGARRNIALSPVLGNKSSPTDPASPLLSGSFAVAALRDHRHLSRRAPVRVGCIRPIGD